MANFKFRQTVIATEEENFYELTSDATMTSYKDTTCDRWVVAMRSFTENDNPDTSPHIESIAMNNLDDGRIERVKTWSGFETQEEVVSLVDYIFKNNPYKAEIAAWAIANNTRTKYEILADNNDVLQVLHDNTVLDQHTINGFVENPDDPFFLEA